LEFTAREEFKRDPGPSWKNITLSVAGKGTEWVITPYNKMLSFSLVSGDAMVKEDYLL
jgi:hypothetical protein